MATRTTGTRSINSTVAMVFGAIFALMGLAGFLVSSTFAETDDNTLLGFEVNHLHNVVHLLIGVVLIAASRKTATARTANLGIGIAYLGLAVLGPFITGTEANILALNSPDHVLHLLSGLVLTAVGAAADKTSRARA
jgi:cyanate permease